MSRRSFLKFQLIKEKRKDYQDFLKTDFWKNISKYKKESLNNKCEGCKSDQNLECHHKFYRDSWFQTKLEDLMVLCRGCHSKIHFDKNPTRYRDSITVERNAFHNKFRRAFRKVKNKFLLYVVAFNIFKLKRILIIGIQELNKDIKWLNNKFKDPENQFFIKQRLEKKHKFEVENPDNLRSIIWE